MKIAEMNKYMDKYSEVLAGIAAENTLGEDRTPDRGICWNMLCQNYRVKAGLDPETSVFYPGVPADFDWEAFGADYRVCYPDAFDAE